MHELISKVVIVDQPRTGVVEEREMFAKMKAEQVRAAKAARRERLLALVGWRKPARRTPPRR